MHPHECGEIRFILTPKQKITHINDAMLRILDAGTEDNEWLATLKDRPCFFLTEEDIPLFNECCKAAANKGTPSYFEHHLYDRRLRRIKMHGWIRKMPDSNEYIIVEIADKELNQTFRNKLFDAVTRVYEDVFHIDTTTASVSVLRNLGAIGYDGDGEINLWDFKNFLLKRLIHPDDRQAYLDFLNILDSDNPQVGLTIECRTLGKTGEVHWLQMTDLHQQSNELLLCFSDITRTKNAAQMQERLETDSVSRIMNRDAFESLCSSLHQKRSYESTYNVLLLIEIDRYDDYPLDRQDALLKKTGELLKTYLHKDVVFARFGDKIFIVCFHDLGGKEDAKKRISDLYKYLHKQSKGESMPGYSFGYAQCSHDPEKGYRCAFECANAALKDAVLSGGNTIRDYDLLSSHSHITQLTHDVKIQTFGYFEVFVDGRPVLFKNKKTKELLAVLVDRRGGYLSSGDVISCLWENESANPKTNARYRKVAMLLKNTLAEYDIDYIVESADRQRRLVSDAVDCDLFHFLAGEETYINNYDGSYMLNYSWSEWTASYLNNIKNPQ